MTDLFADNASVPARIGVIAEVIDGEVSIHLHPHVEVMRYGAVRASVISLMIDLVAGFLLDDDPQTWVLTTDMSVRMRPLPAPDSLDTRCSILRSGGRSATAAVEVVTARGEPVAAGAIGFVRVPRREADPTKPSWPPERITAQFDGSGTLTLPLREAAGITVLDSATGAVRMPVRPDLRNSAGTLQGAMVALVAEVAAEEMISTRFEVPAVVTDLDLRYLAQTGDGPVETRCSLLGEGAGAPIRVEIFDVSRDRMTTLVFARAAVIPT